VLEADEASGAKAVLITLGKAVMGFESWPALLEEDLPDTSVTHRVRCVGCVRCVGVGGVGGGGGPEDVRPCVDKSVHAFAPHAPVCVS
jgi:hypothetical protein